MSVSPTPARHSKNLHFHPHTKNPAQEKRGALAGEDLVVFAGVVPACPTRHIVARKTAFHRVARVEEQNGGYAPAGVALALASEGVFVKVKHEKILSVGGTPV